MTTEELFKEVEAKGLKLVLRSLETMAYHGTCAESATNILAENHIRQTSHKNGHLGKGAYFFETSTMSGPTAARLFAEFERECADPAVLSAEIEIARLLDCGDPDNDPYMNEVKTRMVELIKGHSPKDLRKLDENDVAKFVGHYCPCATNIQAIRYRRFRVPQSRCMTQWGLAVRDSSCITGLTLNTLPGERSLRRAP